MLNRRRFIAGGASALALASLGFSPAALAARRLRLGNGKPFSYAALVEQARSIAARAYAPPPPLPKAVLERIDYEQHGKLKFKPDYALFADGPGPFPVTFFHLGRYFQSPVHMHVVEAGQAREILYDPTYFEMPKDSPARELPKGAGFAGFRYQESRLNAKLDWKKNDWVAFLGASYFRAIGDEYQYGLSARGIAIDVAEPDRPEEFPAFTQIYFETPPGGGNTVTLCALLDGPSVAGAYRFVMQRDRGVIMDVECSLFMRKKVGRLGLVPLTSMYWYSETVKRTAIDWRPEVHDSDGLAMWTGAGERIWRPLNNPPRTGASSFSDENPRGFGLLQRDRAFDHYQDGVNYDKRPSLWIEPHGNWGAGSVQLVEIPTDDEIHDNVVAMWVPKKAPAPGEELKLAYKLHWLADEPYPTPLARCIATRLGRGGEPGRPRPVGVHKFMVEFKGGPLEQLAFGVKPEAVLSTTRGKFSYVFTEAVPNGVAGHWRAQFDLTVDGDAPVDLRLYLRNGTQTLSETWLYQLHPESVR